MNVPLCVPQIVPLHKDTQYKKTRKYVTHEQISLLAKQRGKMGITLNEVMASFACRKNQAQRKLKNMHSSDLFMLGILQKSIDGNKPMDMNSLAGTPYGIREVMDEQVKTVKAREVIPLPMMNQGQNHANAATTNERTLDIVAW